MVKNKRIRINSKILYFLLHLITIYNIIFVDLKERSKKKMRFTHQRFTPILRGLYVDYPNKETKYINESGTNHGLHHVISQILNCENSSYKILRPAVVNYTR